jgi:succinyl-diaminopimelate desuccinylase
MPFLGDSAQCATWGRCCGAFEDELFPALDRKADADAGGAGRSARRSTMNINSIHGGQTDDYFPGLPSPNVPDSCKLVIDRRFLLEEEPRRGENAR